MSTDRKLRPEAFFDAHPVFSLEDFAATQGKTGKLAAARNQLKHHIKRGRVASVGRRVFAVVPHGVEPGQASPDRYLVAALARQDAIFCFHAALELLGAAQSVWRDCTVFTHNRSAPLELNNVTIRFLTTPRPLRMRGAPTIGVQHRHHQNRRLTITGPERTLVEGFRDPSRAGGLEEFVESAAGFPILDFSVLGDVLEAYGERTLWSAVGWFVEAHRERWLPPPEFLSHCRDNRPKANHYLIRGSRGGRLVSGWNVIVPEHVIRRFEDQNA